MLCSMEDEQQTPVTPILLNNHPKPHPNHSKGHVQPPHGFLLPPFYPRSTLPLLFCSRYQSKQRYHCGVEACSSRAPSRVTATGLHDNSAQPGRARSIRALAEALLKDAQCPGANKPDFTTTAPNHGGNQIDQGVGRGVALKAPDALAPTKRTTRLRRPTPAWTRATKGVTPGGDRGEGPRHLVQVATREPQRAVVPTWSDV